MNVQETILFIPISQTIERTVETANLVMEQLMSICAQLYDCWLKSFAHRVIFVGLLSQQGEGAHECTRLSRTLSCGRHELDSRVHTQGQLCDIHSHK